MQEFDSFGVHDLECRALPRPPCAICRQCCSPEPPGVRVSGLTSACRVSGFQLSGFLGFKVSAFRVSGFQGFFRLAEFQLSGFQGLQLTARKSQRGREENQVFEDTDVP